MHQKNCVLVNSPSIFAHRNSGFVQIVLNFFLILNGVYRVHGLHSNRATSLSSFRKLSAAPAAIPHLALKFWLLSFLGHIHLERVALANPLHDVDHFHRGLDQLLGTATTHMSSMNVRHRSGSLSTVNETNCNKNQSKKEMSPTSNSIQTSPTTMRLKMNAIVFVGLDGDALQLVLLIRGVDDFSSRQRPCNQIEVSWAHFCLLCLEQDTIVLCTFSFPLE